jgi:hypothetical protein
MDAAGRPEPSQRAAVTPHPRRPARAEAASTSYQPLIALTRTNHSKRSSRTDVSITFLTTVLIPACPDDSGDLPTMRPSASVTPILVQYRGDMDSGHGSVLSVSSSLSGHSDAAAAPLEFGK